MGIKAVCEVLDHSPEDLSPAERLALVAIAENIRDGDPGRMTWPGFDSTTLIRRVGLGVRGLRQVLIRLAGRGMEVRVPLGTDRLGKPVFAVPGRACRYRLPVLQGGTTVPPSSDDGGTTVPPGGTPVPPKGEPQFRQAAPQFPPTPHSSSSPRPSASSRAKTKPKDRADRLIDQHAPDLDRATVAQHLAEHGKGLGVLAAAERDGTLLDLFATIRAWATPTVQPPRYTDWAQPPDGCGAPGCVNGKVEDPANDYRPKPCPACHSQPVNGHHR